MKTGVVILAGGQSRRMGTDKSLVKCNGVSLLDRAIGRAEKWTRDIVVNANGDTQQFNVKYPIVEDAVGEFDGPLVGILAGLEWSEKQNDLTHILTVAVDTPFFSDDLMFKLEDAVKEQKMQIVLAESGGQCHPVFGIWEIEMATKLREFLTTQKSRKVLDFVHKQKWTEVAFEQEHGIDTFFNINTIDDLKIAEKHAKEYRI